MKSDSNIKRVLIDDGLTSDSLIELHDYENVDAINLKQLREIFIKSESDNLVDLNKELLKHHIVYYKNKNDNIKIIDNH